MSGLPQPEPSQPEPSQPEVAGTGLPPEVRRWSRFVRTPDGHRWHLLDTQPEADSPTDAGTDGARPTLVCVHGNPTWSYLWRRVLDTAPPEWRVVAPDQLGMGWSDRTPMRRLSDRIDDLDRLLDAIGVTGPVALAVHDWGGPVGLGWATRLAARGDGGRLLGLVITNTAVHQPDRPAPGLLRLARSTPLHTLVTRTTPLFVRGAAALSRPALAADVRAGLRAPYRRPGRRQAVADFVADIPFEPEHPSRATLDAVAEGLGRLDVPALLFWGARDPVFTAYHLEDLLDRLPQAQLQRYARASHLVIEDVPDLPDQLWRWLRALDPAASPTGSEPAGSEPAGSAPAGSQILGGFRRPALRSLPAAPRPGTDRDAAVVTLDRTGTATATSAGDLAARVARVAAGLRGAGLRPGQRAALLVPAGVDLAVAVFACWRLGATVVVTDANLGAASLAAALGSAAPDVVLGTRSTVLVARALRIPGRRLRLDRLENGSGSVPTAPPGPTLRLDRPADPTAGPTVDPTADPTLQPDPDAEVAVLFTSGATGPPKGVVYTERRLQAQLDAVTDLMGLGPGDPLVAAFAPFLLYGPALGVPVVVPAMDPTRPSTLTARALADAVRAVGATVVFASPAALTTVVDTAAELDPARREALRGVRRVFSAGAPVGADLLSRVAQLVPAAELHAPYGMTEMLPVTDVTADEIWAAGPGDGVLVGAARPGVLIRIAPLDHSGQPSESLTAAPGVTGEVVVTGAHLKTRYDRLWAVESAAARPPGWHRTGDVGHLDHGGRLWIEGRLGHLITTADGPVTPVGLEQALERLDQVAQAAVVGVGPAGTQQLVAVLRTTPAPTGSTPGSTTGSTTRRRSAVPALPGWRGRRGRLAPAGLAAAARAVAQAEGRVALGLDAAGPTAPGGLSLAAVLVVDALPLDVRHRAKIDRTALAGWASALLGGANPPVPR